MAIIGIKERIKKRLTYLQPIQDLSKSIFIDSWIFKMILFILLSITAYSLHVEGWASLFKLPNVLFIFLLYAIFAIYEPTIALLFFIFYTLSGIKSFAPSYGGLLSLSILFEFFLFFSMLIRIVLKKRHIFPTDFQSILIFLFFLILSVSAIIFNNILIKDIPGTSIIKSNLFILLIYVLCLFFVNSFKKLLLLLKIMLLVSLLHGVLSNIQYYSHDVFNFSYHAGYLRAESFGLEDPNYLAVLLIMMMPIAYIIVLKDKSYFWRYFALLTFILSIFTVLLTLSRTGIFLLLSTLFILLYISYKKHRKILRWLILLAPIMFIFFKFAPHDLWQRLSELTSDKGSGRLYLYKSAFDTFIHNPLFGVGYGNFAKFEFYFSDWGTIHRTGTHNMYLSIAVELGLPTLLLYLAIFISAFKNLKKIVPQETAINKDDDYLFGITRMVMMSISIFLLGGFFLHYYMFLPIFIFLVIVNLIVNIQKSSNRNPNIIPYGKS